MKLLVLSQTPPPLHGQSLMVQTLVDSLPARGIAVHHINFRLSRDAADIGRWRPGKIFAAVGAALRAVVARFTQGCDTLYYVPAPPKRGALYRDWVVMALCRGCFPKLILHWHAAGLGNWLETDATRLERWLTRRLLGRAALSIVLADALADDACRLEARRVAVVANGVADPGPPEMPKAGQPFSVLFLGLCSENKGLFDAAAAVLEANRRHPNTDAQPSFTLTAAGPFEDAATAEKFAALVHDHPLVLRHVGVADAAAKERLFADCHVLCLPTRHVAEGMPLVALEALAHGRPVIATRWRALPEIVTPDVGRLVAPGDVAELANALVALRDQPIAAEVCRARYEARYTLEHHLTALAAALRTIESPTKIAVEPHATAENQRTGA